MPRWLSSAAAGFRLNLAPQCPRTGVVRPRPGILATAIGVYGELDDRVNAGLTALRPALDAAGIVYQINIYPQSAHAFHEDTGATQ